MTVKVTLCNTMSPSSSNESNMSASCQTTPAAAVPEIAKSSSSPSPETISQPSQYDVLCHRCPKAFNHIGNRRFRVIVENHASSYSKIELKAERSIMIKSIVANIESSGVRFLKMNKKEGTWMKIVSLTTKKEKVAHALRAAAAADKKSRTIYDVIQGTEVTRKRQRTSCESSSSSKQQLPVNLDTTNVSLSSSSSTGAADDGVSIWCNATVEQQQTKEEAPDKIRSDDGQDQVFTMNSMESRNDDAVSSDQATEDKIRQLVDLRLAAVQLLQLR